MAFNLMKNFQVATTASSWPASRKRRTIYALETIQSLRYRWINRAGVLVHPDGYPTLDVGSSPGVANCFKQIDEQLRAVA